MNKIVRVVGKGPTAKYLKHSDYPNDIFVAINQAAIFMDEIDYLFANDIEGLNGIPDDKYDHIKNIAIPEHPHLDGMPRNDVTYEFVMNKLKHKNLNYIIYNLHTWNNPNPNLVTPEGAISTGGIAIGYFLKYKNIKHFETYGIGTGRGYNSDIYNYITKDNVRFENNWKDRRMGDLNHSIVRIANMYGATVKFN